MSISLWALPYFPAHGDAPGSPRAFPTTHLGIYCFPKEPRCLWPVFKNQRCKVCHSSQVLSGFILVSFLQLQLFFYRSSISIGSVPLFRTHLPSLSPPQTPQMPFTAFWLRHRTLVFCPHSPISMDAYLTQPHLVVPWLFADL